MNNRQLLEFVNEFKSKYLAEIVNAYGITLDKKIITENEINKVIYSKKKRN